MRPWPVVNANERHKMASRKHVTLVADTDTSVTVTGNGIVLVSNHGVTGTSVGDAVYVNINAAATVRGDEMIGVLTGRPRGILNQDRDGTVVVHLISHSTNEVSVELVDPGLVEFVV